jgi:hypothetical protein
MLKTALKAAAGMGIAAFGLAMYAEGSVHFIAAFGIVGIGALVGSTVMDDFDELKDHERNQIADLRELHGYFDEEIQRFRQANYHLMILASAAGAEAGEDQEAFASSPAVYN